MHTQNTASVVLKVSVKKAVVQWCIHLMVFIATKITLMQLGAWKLLIKNSYIPARGSHRIIVARRSERELTRDLKQALSWQFE